MQGLLENWQSGLTHAEYQGVCLAAGDESLHFQDDHGPTYKPNPYFTQWVSPEFTQPGALLCILPESSKPVTLLTLKFEDYWHAQPNLPDYLSEFVDIRTFADSEALAKAARELCGNQTTAYIGMDPGNELPGEINPQPLLDYMDFNRAIKSDYELELMRIASDIGVAGHKAAEEKFLQGGTEFEIHLAYLAASAQNETALPYGNIVALNEHAAILHYQHQDRHHRSPAKSLLIDAGGQFCGYASDITRTYVQPGDEHAEFAALLAEMQQHQDRILAQVKPGQSFADLHEFMHRSLCDVLVAAELVTCDAETAFEQRVNEKFCPHGLGHLLGIQVHDVGGHLADNNGTPSPPSDRYPKLRFTREIENDQVFTIEPGLYFIDSLLAEAKQDNAPVNWQNVEALHPYGGIRLEDNVRVLADGCENLTRDAYARL